MPDIPLLLDAPLLLVLKACSHLLVCRTFDPSKPLPM